MANNYLVVVGSCMIDFVSYAPRLPKDGETIHGTKFETNFGGKGANQCVAAAKLGAKSYFLARVGDDIWGDKYLDNLRAHQIKTDFVSKTQNISTGIAQIVVSYSGSNQIVIVSGANEHLAEEDLEKARSIIENTTVLVVQLETKPEVAIKAMQICGGISILNAAPAMSKFNPLLLKLPTYFCVNETEASIFTNLPVNNRREAESACQKLLELGCKHVILTLGADGALFWSDREKFHVESSKVKCVDSTGAGDSFIGALAYFLIYHRDLPIETIMRFSCYIASNSVTKVGTQKSYPNADILNDLPIKSKK